jgi:hypothetical protein
MASTKKTAPKKAPVRKTTAAPKKATRKAVPKGKATTKQSRVTEKDMRSFRVYSEPDPFTSMRFTRQTFYWLILAAFIVFVQLWIVQLQLEVVSIMDAQQAQLLDQ